MEFPFDLARGRAEGQVEGKLRHHLRRVYWNEMSITGEYMVYPMRKAILLVLRIQKWAWVFDWKPTLTSVGFVFFGEKPLGSFIT